MSTNRLKFLISICRIKFLIFLMFCIIFVFLIAIWFSRISDVEVSQRRFFRFKLIKLFYKVKFYPQLWKERFLRVHTHNMPIGKSKYQFLKKFSVLANSGLFFKGHKRKLLPFKFMYFLWFDNTKFQFELKNFLNILFDFVVYKHLVRFFFICSDNKLGVSLLNILSRLGLSYGLNKWFAGGLTNFNMILRYLWFFKLIKQKNNTYLKKFDALAIKLPSYEKTLSIMLFSYGFRFLYKKLPPLSFISNNDNKLYPVLNELINKDLLTCGLSGTFCNFTYLILGNVNSSIFKLIFNLLIISYLLKGFEFKNQKFYFSKGNKLNIENFYARGLTQKIVSSFFKKEKRKKFYNFVNFFFTSVLYCFYSQRQLLIRSNYFIFLIYLNILLNKLLAFGETFITFVPLKYKNYILQQQNYLKLLQKSKLLNIVLNLKNFIYVKFLLNKKKQLSLVLLLSVLRKNSLSL